MKIPVGISNHHIHLTKEVYKKLFNSDELIVKRYLLQTGEYASASTLKVEANGKVIDNIRIVGPFRNYNQVELLKEDADYLNINAPLRDSSDLDNCPSLILKTPLSSVKIESCAIIANRHIHVPTSIAKKNNLNDKMIVSVKTKDNKTIDNVHIKISDKYKLEFHINKDEAALYNLENGEEVILC